MAKRRTNYENKMAAKKSFFGICNMHFYFDVHVICSFLCFQGL